LIESRQLLTGEAVARHYDELDHFYRNIWGEHVHHGLWRRGDESPEIAVAQLVRHVAAQAELKHGSRVCDIGCGYGATARMLAREFDASVVGVTISPAQFAFAISQRNGNSNPGFLLCDWLENDLPDENFDAAIAIESSEHMIDKPAFFDQAHRVLRRGGRFVICAWLANADSSRLEKRWILEPICREGRMPAMGAEADYKRFFEQSGFDLESFEDLSAHVKKTWPICIRRFLINLCRKPSYVKFLLNSHSSNRIFALTILRICIAYNTGAMRYGIFAARKV